MDVELATDLEFDYKARSDKRDNSYRLRSPNAVRKNRRSKGTPGTPGSSRLRRNKHWNW